MHGLTFFLVVNKKRTGKRNGIVLRQSEYAVQPDFENPVSVMGWRTQPNRRQNGVWIKRLEGFVRLEKLAVVTEWFPSGFPTPGLANPLMSLINAIIMRNASTLTTIDMGCLQFDHKPEHAVLVYGKLQNLICEKLTPAVAAACPRLVRLRASRPVSAEVMQNLPLETMQYLDAHTQDPQEIGTFVAAVSRMTHLKELNLAAMTCDTSVINPKPSFIKLFSNMNLLEKIDISFLSDVQGPVDAAVDRLVRNNPRLTHIRFTDADDVTGASLVSLSCLTGVRRLFLWHFGTHMLTVDDVLTLLRGGSREVLHSLEVYMRSRPDMGRIEAEAKVMEQEMGCTFSVLVDTDRTLCWVSIKRGRKRNSTARKR